MTEPTEPGYYWCRPRCLKVRKIVEIFEQRGGLLKVREMEFKSTLSIVDFTDWSGPIKEEPPCPQ